jgi:hypothetical protein
VTDRKCDVNIMEQLYYQGNNGTKGKWSRSIKALLCSFDGGRRGTRQRQGKRKKVKGKSARNS